MHVLYHAISTFHLLNCIAHRLTVHPDANAMLIIDSNDLCRTGHSSYNELIDAGFFSEIHRFPYHRIDRTNPIDSTESIYKEITSKKLCDFDEIIIGGIHFSLALICCKHRIRFSAFEDGPGSLSRADEFITGLKRVNVELYRTIVGTGLEDYTCPWINTIYFVPEAQREGFNDPRAVPFVLRNELQKLSSEQRQILIEWFGGKAIKVNELKHRDTLLLTQNLAGNRFISYRTQTEMFETLLRTFSDESHTIIKPHPDENFPYARKFPQATVLPPVFPLELLDTLIHTPFTNLLMIDSSGAKSIKDMAQNTHMMYWDYLYSYRLTDEYLISLKIIDRLRNSPADSYSVYTIGIDRYHWDELRVFFYPESSDSYIGCLNTSTQLKTKERIDSNQPIDILIIDVTTHPDCDTEISDLWIENCLANKGIILCLNNPDNKRIAPNCRQFPFPISTDKLPRNEIRILTLSARDLQTIEKIQALYNRQKQMLEKENDR